ncbi:MAG: SUMF1/EgtB/PvdO family nonheme iron enzyme, partial [Pseudomonadales bacterium]|nr:SUMF1/EgtB/PvdO family nonheme iron enzyme [Pseudomonadales bacterium]
QPSVTAVRGSPELEEQLQARIDQYREESLAKLYEGQELLAFAKLHFNFDAEAIAEVERSLKEALAPREEQVRLDTVALEDTISYREEQARLAELRKEEEAAKLARNALYQNEHLPSLLRILRCKGSIASDLENLGQLLQSMQANFPEQFERDKPGIADALAGCIEQRVAARDPEEARLTQKVVMGYLPDQPRLAQIEISDLDPCDARNLVGNGTRNRSWCTDKLAVGGESPEMVVVPGQIGKSMEKFAISRIEIRIADYNFYCQQTGCAQISGNPSLPVTNISVADANNYAAWLSEQSGKQYRLPTEEEWLYAASTNTPQVDDNVNCTVDSRGVRLGDKLLNTLSGRPNSWGLYNYVGNAREWVVAGDELKAVGGAHTDPKPECRLDYWVQHTGEPDLVTGFRLVRAIESRNS